ncbi:phage portal protein [Pseudooceanicola sp. CBS1P-1]|uniref:Phage portal protein n=1 Tax=Pseudooceanicola albus TaxID=2692189 RepID=A0A6L7GA62_9RHOB|nr:MULTISPECIES: phage portal protein [Pseudooceanicola]MBT9384247.1 phage portal protein [Pseudooceanicola endophyticus]MXN20839.1 phage portal protein [Pseudooceanicola albus]
MGVIDYFRKDAGSSDKGAPERKASATGRIVAYASGGRVAWSARDTASLTRTGFTANPVVFRAVKLVAEAAASLPLILQDEARRYDQHPVLSLLRNPNPMQGRAELFEALYGQMLLTGNAYMEAVAAEEGTPVELYVLRSDRMSLVPGADGWPVAFDYTVNSSKVRFDVSGPRSPILHLKTFHPQDDHYGLSPLQAAAQALDVHNSASRWSKALLDNAARPSGAIVYKGTDGESTMSPDQFDRLVAEMEMYHQGAANAGRPMLLEGGLDWKPMGFSPSDMEFHKTKEAAAREIAIALGVPPMLLGIPGEATYANYQEAHRAFFRLTVLPLVTRVTAAVAEWLERFSGEQLELRPDLDRVPALSAERDSQWKRIGEADFLTRAEKRAALGLPPLDDGDA